MSEFEKVTHTATMVMWLSFIALSDTILIECDIGHLLFS